MQIASKRRVYKLTTLHNLYKCSNMFVKIAAITLMAFITTSKGNIEWTGLRAHWAVKASDANYPLPQTLDDAVSEGWTEISGVAISDSEIGLGYYGDPLVVLLFSTYTGEVFGVQVNMRKADLDRKDVPADYTLNRAMTLKTLNGEEYFTSTAYFNRDNRKIWILEQDGGLLEFPTSARLAQEKIPFIKNPCVPWMGVHYNWISKTTSCSEIYPWILLVIDDDVIGLGYFTLGNSTAGSNRIWFDTLVDPVPVTIVQTIPDSPLCLVDGSVVYGYSLFHIWFIDNPRDITCYNNSTAARLQSTAARVN